MKQKNPVQADLEKRVRHLEDLIAEKGIGSSYLSRARRMQRNLNLAILLGGMVALTGLTVLTMRSLKREED